MAIWSPQNIIVTQKGQELLSKAQAGVGQITITRVVTGSGRVDNAQLFNQTKVSTIKQEMSIVKVNTNSTGSTLELQVINSGLTSSYRLNQIGVYASHPDIGEVLYMIAQCDEDTADLVPKPEETPITLTYQFGIIHSPTTNVNVTLDPSGMVTVGQFEDHLEDYQKLCDFVGYNDSEVYGVEVDYESGQITRIGANEGLTPEDFDNIEPWGGRKRCNLTDEGAVLAYYGDEAYTETGALTKAVVKNGVTYPVGTKVQVMVEQPKFWYKLVPIKLEKYEGQEGYSISKAKYYISTTPRIGFKVFPLFTRGIPLREADVAYLAAYRSSLYDVSEPKAEINTLTITKGVDIGGNITITIDFYGETKTVALLDTDTTPEAVAKRIRATSFAGWKLSGEGADVVFTCNTTGAKNPITLVDTDNTGITFSVTQTQIGEGGYVETDAQVADLTPITGDKLCSIAGVKPAGGRVQKFSRANASILAKNRNYDPETQTSRFDDGFGWQQRDISANSCITWLHLIEYASFNCRATIGDGITSVDSVPGRSVSALNGCTSALGNKSGTAPSGVYSNKFGERYAVSYRGEENLWGNSVYLEEGLNIRVTADGLEPYYSVSGIYTDSVGDEHDGYKYAGFNLCSKTGFTKKVGYSEHLDWAFLTTDSSGNSMKPTNDYYYKKVNVVAGTYAPIRYTDIHGSNVTVGLVSRNIAVTSTYRNTECHAYLMFIPDPTPLN